MQDLITCSRYDQEVLCNVPAPGPKNDGELVLRWPLPLSDVYFTICHLCENYERECIVRDYAHHKRKSDVPCGRVEMHGNFSALERSASEGCSLCCCWRSALVSECMTPALLQELMLSVWITTPMSSASDISSDSNLPSFRVIYTVECDIALDRRGRSIQWLPARDPRCSKAIEQARERVHDCHAGQERCNEVHEQNNAPLPERLLDVRSHLTQLADGYTIPTASYMALSYFVGFDSANTHH